MSCFFEIIHLVFEKINCGKQAFPGFKQILITGVCRKVLFLFTALDAANAAINSIEFLFFYCHLFYITFPAPGFGLLPVD